MSRNIENMERLKEVRLFSLGMRGEITVLEYVKGSCEGEGSKLFSVAGGGRPRSAELELRQGKEVSGKISLASDRQRSRAAEQMV